MPNLLRQIAALDRVQRISFFETLLAQGDRGRAHLLLLLARADEASRAAFYQGMHGNAIERWETQRLAQSSPAPEEVSRAEGVVGGILEEVVRVAAEIAAGGAGLAAFSEGEIQLLTALKRTVNRGREATRENLARFGAERFFRYLVDWDRAYEGLAGRELLTETDGVYGLTVGGRVYANLANRDRPIWLYLYNELYLRAEGSRAYSAFCEQVYGKDLRQFGQADMAQIHALVDEVGIGPESRVLDLGCGDGTVTEYISNRTGAHVTGLDVADQAIERAVARTEAKRHRLAFQVGNLNALDGLPRSFDAVIAIDALHISVDLAGAVRGAAAALRPGGRMGVFWESWIRAGTPDTHLHPDHTRLAQVLQKLGLSYRTIDFSEANRALWLKARRVLEELRPDFEAEGNAVLYETVMGETGRIDQGRGCRYLYVVSAGPPGWGRPGLLWVRARRSTGLSGLSGSLPTIPGRRSGSMGQVLEVGSAKAVASQIDAEIRALPVRKAPTVRAVRRKYSRLLKAAEPEFMLEVARELLRRYGYHGVPFELIRTHPGAFQRMGAAELEELGQGMDSWWSVDSFARTLSGPAWLRGQVSDEVIHRWARSEDLWWRRAALVSTVALNVRSRGGYGDVPRTLDVCRRLVGDHEDMVVKALSWALRDLVVHDPDAVREFLKEHEAVLAARVKREVGNKLETGLKNPKGTSR